MSKEITKNIYDKHAQSWMREKPNSMSDFTGRPPVFELCGDVTGKEIVDIGCGEGYCSRVLKKKGAKSLEGIDISPEMIKLAKNQNRSELSNFQVGDITQMPYENSSFDLALGMFVYNYLNIDQMTQSFKEVYRILKSEGSFVFAVPHPAFPFIKNNLAPPFFFEFNNKGYFSARDSRNFGQISCIDKQTLPVQMVHKLFEDYISSLKESGFVKIPIIKELGVTKEHLSAHPEFFEPVKDLPLHLVINITK
jgi:ubiquinone/menaquinone biosynthesis C-methylase UbiE